MKRESIVSTKESKGYSSSHYSRPYIVPQQTVKENVIARKSNEYESKTVDVWNMEKDKSKEVSFLAQSLYEEVIQGNKKQQKNKMKKLKKLHKGFTSILLVAIMHQPLTAFAQPQTNPPNTPIIPATPGAPTTQATSFPTLTEGASITPDIVMGWGLNIALMTVAIGVAVASGLFVIAGVYRMFRKRKEAEEWSTDIIKGLVQVLVAVPLVYALFHLAQIVFGSIPVLNGLSYNP